VPEPAGRFSYRVRRRNVETRYKPGAKVIDSHPRDIVNRAIAIPAELRSDDGRRFHIIEWTAEVSTHNAVEVSTKVLVSFPEEQ
jgi:hypothetical protein